MSFNPRLRSGLLMAASVAIAITALAWSGSRSTNNIIISITGYRSFQAKHHSTQAQDENNGRTKIQTVKSNSLDGCHGRSNDDFEDADLERHRRPG